MQLSNEEEDNNLSLEIWVHVENQQSTLFWFEEFEEILHYLDMGKAALAKKALKLALDQHPKSTGLKLVQVECSYWRQVAEKLLNELYMPSDLRMKKFSKKISTPRETNERRWNY
jgi:hypothetical protein